ncbi:hypothetical protein Nepgr_030669 [Nepenthes gracilis]|uniref:tRNA/rRNA methyltransferase SpoU type domain-containing protein n=1 Tax=Nepenthes gracilis TaxID=150966 RepID=A0AAD3TGP7_NEPGR|nr:hypothetical protein Nepgr_030669 [Nepenthes gracilis]
MPSCGLASFLTLYLPPMSSSETDSMDALLTSLSDSFGNVPPAAIPAMLDCILASANVSPSILFDSLLGDFITFTKDNEGLGSEQCKSLVARFCALCHLLRKSGVGYVALQSFIWKSFVPLVKMLQLNERGMLNEIMDYFCEVVIETNSWGIIEATLAPFLLRSVGVSMDMHQNEDIFIIEVSRHPVIQGLGNQLHELAISRQNVLPISGCFPLIISCYILSYLLDAALQSNHALGSTLGSFLANGCNGDEVSQNLLLDLCDMAIRMLSHSLEHRSCAVSLLLPAIFKSFASNNYSKVCVCGERHGISRNGFLRQIWKCCKTLFALGPMERRDAYGIISLYLSYFSCGDLPEDANMDDRAEEFDIRAERELWEEIRRGLVDKEGLVRKQALYILKKMLLINEGRQPNSNVPEKKPHRKSLAPHGRAKRDLWAEKEAKSLGIGVSWTAVDSCLNKWQKWDAFLLLYEMLEEYGTHLVEAAWNHQLLLLLQSSFQNDSSMNPIAADDAWMEILVGSFDWLDVLWERGLSHDNPQVRCLIMQSFLDIEWKNQGNCAKFFPENFLLGPFIEGLNDPVHHKEFGLKGVYCSKVIKGARRFLHQYCSLLSRRKRISFLCNLASIARQQSLGRAGLMSLVECISSASVSPPICTVGIDNSHDSQTKCCRDDLTDVLATRSPETCLCNEKTDFIDGLRFLVQSGKQHFNPNYRLRVCEKALEAAASVVCARELPLAILMHFVSALPHEFTDVGGPLRIEIEEWLVGLCKKECAVNCCNNTMQLLRSLCDFCNKFTYSNSFVNSLDYDDEDLVSWRSESERWARLLFLLTKEEQHLEPVFMFIISEGANICQQNKQVVSAKFLMLALSLVHELQILQRKTDAQASLVEMFSDAFHVILEELISFTALSCSIFWSSKVLGETRLPGFLTGKLGGPSQRRLSSPMVTAVLQAITSIKTVSSISYWCSLSRKDYDLNSAYTFLWEFFHKVVSNPMCDSETSSEIHLGAYEALSSVLKASVPVFSVETIILIRQINSSLLPIAEDKPLLDSLVLTFLKHINNLLAIGLLTRTRAAMLLNWKWLCLESLLSIPHHALENGVHLECNNSFFSDDAIRCIYDDLVESLENAGEDSILPMLRSVRTVLDLLTSDSSFIFSCRGVDVQMMWRLVRSSWVLHISCDKRRVAPIAVLLSSVLHASVFRDEGMHMADNAPGPLKWFTEKVLEEGTKSPRTIRLAALHLTGLWLLNPRTIKYYIKELKLLTLYGSVAFDEDFEAELTENDDARAEVSLLAKSPDPEMTEAFVNTELYARVSVAVLFYKLGELAKMVGLKNEFDASSPADESGKLFLLELLDSVVTDKDLSKELYKKYSAVHRRKIRAWQMICVLSRFVDQDVIQQVTRSLHISLYRNNFPGVRQYLETFSIHLFLKFPSLVGEQLVPIFHDYDMRTQALSSYVFVAANLILHSNGATQSQHLYELLPPIIPLLTSHHHTLRGFTQLLVYQVLSNVLPALDSSCSKAIPIEKKCFNELKSYLALNTDCMRLRASMEGILNTFNPHKSVSPAGIFSNRIDDLEFECVPMSLMEQVINFLNNAREDLRCSMAKDEITVKNESLMIELDPKRVDLSEISGKEELLAFPSSSISMDFQRKFTSFKHEMQDFRSGSFKHENMQQSLLEMEREDQLCIQSLHSRVVSLENLKANRQQFILVASLIDRLPNLAGLTRTCEVFKATGLAIADVNVLHDKQFQLISVTAEKWIPITEVPVNSVKTFLEKKKQEGFSVLGLEQTANSIPLDKYKFPKRTVLVLGHEKKGIPVDIIHILDACIEIPQLGVVSCISFWYPFTVTAKVFLVIMEGDPFVCKKTSLSHSRNDEDIRVYKERMGNEHDIFLESVLALGSYRKLYSYTHLLNGFAIHVKSEEAIIPLRNATNVRSIHEDIKMEKLTTHTPDYLGIPKRCLADPRWC